MLFAINYKENKCITIIILTAINDIYAAKDAVEESIAICLKHAAFNQSQIEYSENACENFNVKIQNFTKTLIVKMHHLQIMWLLIIIYLYKQ